MVTRYEDPDPATDQEKVFATYKGLQSLQPDVVNTKAEASVAKNTEAGGPQSIRSSIHCALNNHLRDRRQHQNQ